MGTWAVGSFGNDSAGDWVIDLKTNPTFEFLRETLQASLEDSLDAMANENAVAAAEVLCILNGHIPDDYQEVEHNLSPAIAALKSRSQPQDLKALAYEALTQIETNSELKELWEDNEEWTEQIKALKTRLSD